MEVTSLDVGRNSSGAVEAAPLGVQTIYDANNWLRRRFEGGASIRVCLAEIKVRPGVVVFDGPGALKRRRAVYPGYKNKRKSLPENMVKQFELAKELLQHYSVPCVCVPGWEADDVIATLIRLSHEKTHIKSTDADFLQLSGVTIDRETAFPAPSYFIRAYKSAVGDPSDNIPGIKGFGKKAWAALSDTDRFALDDFFAQLTDVPPACLSPAQHSWLEANLQLVRSFYNITNLYTVPMDEILAGTTIGVDNEEAAALIFKRFLL